MPNTRQHTLQLTEEAFAPSGLLLSAHGELELATVPALRERLAAARGAGVKRLVLDLSGVSFMDSIALAAIVHAEQQLGEGGAMAVVVEPGSYVVLILEIAGMPAQLNLVESRAEALARVGAA